MPNLLHLYTGTGKGKTTAAMGLAVRALGHGSRVLVGQFIKDGRSGELIALAKFDTARVMPAAPLTGFLRGMTPEQRERECRRQTEYARSLIDAVREFAPQMIVLDELAMAAHMGVVGEKDASALIDACLESGETAVTGRNAPLWLAARADYVSRIDAVRHPFDTRHISARKGVEW